MHAGYWYSDRFLPPIAGGSGEDEPSPDSPPAPPDDPGSEMLRRELEEYQRLAEERGQALAARDAELASLRRTAEQHRDAAEAVQRQLLAAHRARLLAEHHGRIVDDLVQGDTVDELNASVARAEAAYNHVAEQVRTAAAASVPAGNAARTGADLAMLSPQEKIAYGLRNGR